MGVTLRDVAQRVGVSAGVASTVLSGKKNSIGVSIATQLKVREAARELGYILPKREVPEGPSYMGRRRTERGQSPLYAPDAGRPTAAGVVGISCYLGHQDDFWHRLTLNALESVLADNGIVSRFFNLYQGDDAPPVLADQANELLESDAIQALVIVDIHDAIGTAQISETLPAFLHKRIPVVCITNRELPVPVPNIINDQFASGTLAALHLLERGGDRRLHFYSPFNKEWAKARIAGACAGAEIAGLGADVVVAWDKMDIDDHCAYASPDAWDNRSSAAATRFVREQLLPAYRMPESRSVPLSVIAASDKVAFDCIAAAAKEGLIVQRDFLIVGFDDTTDARSQGLTSLHPPLREMGEEAGRILVRLMAGDRMNPQTRLRSRVIARDSTIWQP
ncbi:MAG: LacI family DNA-binding transcriptional regulator [Fibrella sp.]|nr:LacI family DNA-binding transcriptional regulator [Armatimonadota bacterium]